MAFISHRKRINQVAGCLKIENSLDCEKIFGDNNGFNETSLTN